MAVVDRIIKNYRIINCHAAGVRDAYLKKEQCCWITVEKLGKWTHTKARESVSDKRWAPFANLTPSIHPSFPLSSPSTIPSVRSVILSIPSVHLPLSGFGQSLADPDKRMLPVMEKEQRSRLSRGGGRRCRGGRVSGLDKLCQSCGYPLLFLGSLLMRRPPRPSLPSLISVCVVHLKERGKEKLEMRQMSGTKPLARSALRLLSATVAFRTVRSSRQTTLGQLAAEEPLLSFSFFSFFFLQALPPVIQLFIYSLRSNTWMNMNKICQVINWSKWCHVVNYTYISKR